MWSHPIVVVAVIALLACVHTASASADSKVIAPKSSRVLTANHRGVLNHRGILTKRLLRIDDADTEERAFSIPGLSNVKEAINSATSKIKLSYNLRTRLKHGESADDVGKFLILDDNVESVLSNPNINTLAKYISKSNEKNSERVLMIDVLTKRYGEAEVSKMLVAAKNVKSREVWATKLQGDQVAGWFNRDETALGVFKILKLDDASTSPFTTRNLEAWKNYVEILAKRKPEHAATMFDTFRKVYKDEGLARLIDASRSIPGARPVAVYLKVSLFTRWKNGGVSMANINTKVFRMRHGDEIDKATKRIVSQYKAYLRRGDAALI